MYVINKNVNFICKFFVDNVKHKQEACRASFTLKVKI